MFLITLSSKHGQSYHTVGASEVNERLRQIGLEWKNADQFYDHEVIITIRPFDPDIEGHQAELEGRLAKIAEIAT